MCPYYRLFHINHNNLKYLFVKLVYRDGHSSAFAFFRDCEILEKLLRQFHCCSAILSIGQEVNWQVKHRWSYFLSFFCTLQWPGNWITETQHYIWIDNSNCHQIYFSSLFETYRDRYSIITITWADPQPG